VHDRFWIFPHTDALAGLRPRIDAMLAGENPPPRAQGSVDANGLRLGA
jgi:hypothetical protein